MLKFLVVPSSLVVLSGCAGVDQKEIVELDNYGVCSGYLRNQAMPTGGRVAFGVMSLGITEAFEAGKRSKLETYAEELKRRGISDCSSKGLAKFECASIHADAQGAEYKQCVLSLENTIAARRSAASAKAAAAASLYKQSQSK